MKLFKTKSRKVKEACQDIHVIIEDNQRIIADTKCHVADMQDGIEQMKRNNEEYLKSCKQIFDEMRIVLDGLVGDTE